MASIPTDIDVFYVVYRPDLQPLKDSLQALAEQQGEGFQRLHLCMWDNSQDVTVHAELKELLAPFRDIFASTRLIQSEDNLGFGRGNNRLLDASEQPWVLLMNQDAVPEPGALHELATSLASQGEQVAALELRQIPFEHPKEYNPSTGITPWVSGAACLIRREALTAVGGFDEGFFMYAEDVDLSWRLRAAGWQLVYVPRAAVWHDTYRNPGEEKPMQAVEGTLNNLLMRVRYGRLIDVFIGLLGVFREVLAPSSFKGRRWQFLRLYARFARLAPQYHRSRIRPAPGVDFAADFRGWNFSRHREGAFVSFRRAEEWAEHPQPLVSIIVRTHKRPAMLREALQSLVRQTWNNLQVVVVEDGEPLSQPMLESEFASLNLRYLATGQNVGRSAAGNRALALAEGEWIGFLDDDDQLFADHIEVLLSQAQNAGVKGVYGLADEVLTELNSVAPLDYRETGTLLRYRQPFSRFLLWHHNYLPIQSVLFHRSLYEQHGGFAEDMDQLEDWDLWVRYSLEHDFLMLEKTTSRYRVPASQQHSKERLAQLDAAYVDARRRQDALQFTISPRQFVDMAEAYHSGLAVQVQRHARLRVWLQRMGLLGLARQVRGRWLRLRGH
ncbi:glycosyltransferase family 2 protein [Halopseudomonas salegens]|uniref:Glycosyltransferase, GT2 family n=1 Tax=Halopseudomonas salegens TaxID=1434072 RepID=A0A1H2HVZ3_9GAMM|nr:glycosyltransferase [Halopseudomonas salegens]SDU35885.1 Glycosyltransferase, GT2 family [Halopseudomonas salegens]